MVVFLPEDVDCATFVYFLCKTEGNLFCWMQGVCVDSAELCETSSCDASPAEGSSVHLNR